MVTLVQAAPLETLHLPVRRTGEDASDPVDHRREVGLEFADADVVPMLREVRIDVFEALGGRDPVQRDS